MVVEPSWLTEIHLGYYLDIIFSPSLEKAKSSDNEFVLWLVRVLLLLYHHPKTEVYQLIIHDGLGWRKLLLEEAYCTPLTGHMGACKLILALL